MSLALIDQETQRSEGKHNKSVKNIVFGGVVL